jgi:hypothetical protein
MGQVAEWKQSSVSAVNVCTLGAGLDPGFGAPAAMCPGVGGASLQHYRRSDTRMIRVTE